MSAPVVAKKGSYVVNVEAGESYWWCTCGKSKSQPFCDGRHDGTDFSPVQYVATESGSVHFCGCKNSVNQPKCDGTHRQL